MGARRASRCLLGALLSFPCYLAGNGEKACERLLRDHVEQAGAADLEGWSAVGRILHAMDLSEALSCGERAQLLSDGREARVAYFIEQVALHPLCVEELNWKSTAETRCVQRWYKIAIHFLRYGGDIPEAKAMWDRAVSSGVSWPSPDQTPTIWLPGLQPKPFWDCQAHWPFMRELEAHASEILAEIEQAKPYFEKAYPYLTQQGKWQDMFLVRGSEWNHELCAALPQTCRLLLPEIPTKPGVPYATAFHEEVVIFRSEPGTYVSPHCGSSNMVINLHLTLSGGNGTKLDVAGDPVELQSGKAVCFQDSYFHAVEHGTGGSAERISLVVRAMHPELSREAYGNASRTDVSDLASWDTAAALSREAERLRVEYRRLAQEERRRLTTEGCSVDSGRCSAL
eukprot:TRINITY_DN13022_c0_g1_i2.p1 TRINITY_DN13022_c0_g1~~TRINITY_DN13022_c0_g1_i2.p1  ORF type:complete len:398 (-),score=53.64 TRINITY_DN13022_c0_g1_i2:70-1263(-)